MLPVRRKAHPVTARRKLPRQPAERQHVAMRAHHQDGDIQRRDRRCHHQRWSQVIRGAVERCDASRTAGEQRRGHQSADCVTGRITIQGGAVHARGGGGGRCCAFGLRVW